MTIVEATVNGAISLVNAIATGNGATLGIDTFVKTRLEVKEGTGIQSPKEFDQSMKDLTNFLAYMTDPMKKERESIGVYVLLYLFIFTILSYLLYIEFKKDLH